MTEGNKPKATEPHVPSPNNNDDEKAAVPDQDYGYEELDKPTEIPNQSRKVQRRNVVKADEAIYNLSYHPGRVVSFSSRDACNDHSAFLVFLFTQNGILRPFFWP